MMNITNSISNCCIRKSTVSSFPSSFIKFMALSLAFVLFMPKKIVSLMGFSSALAQGNLHLLAIFTTSPEFIELAWQSVVP